MSASMNDISQRPVVVHGGDIRHDDPVKKKKTQQQQKKSSTSATNGASEQTNENGARKRKRSGPFRVKAGCVVALRHRPELSNVPIKTFRRDEEQSTIVYDNDWVYAWTKPFPGRDEGLALIGKRIRCFFLIAEGGSDRKRKVLEGEVVRVINYGEKLLRGMNRGMTVELLIDKSQFERFSFLTRSDTEPGATANETAKRNFRLEETIRGKNKVCVHVSLMKAWWMEYGKEDSKYNRWAIQKLVPARLFRKRQSPKFADGKAAAAAAEPSSDSTKKLRDDDATNDPASKKRPLDGATPVTKKPRTKSPGPIMTTARHLGDGNDDADQQMNNWRWAASRYHDILLSESVEDSLSAEILSGGFVGQVVKVESGGMDGTLALVTLTRMFLPEHTSSGRLPQHTPWSVFDGAGEDGGELKVPIEQLIIVSRKLVHDISEPPTPNIEDVLDVLVSSKSYSLTKDFYFCREIAAFDDNEHCHRCRCLLPDGELNAHSDSEKVHGAETTQCRQCTAADRAIKKFPGSGDGDTIDAVPVLCECRECIFARAEQIEYELNALARDAQPDASLSVLSFASKCIQSADVVDFCLPGDFVATSSFPAALNQPSTKVKARQPKKPKRPPGRPGRPPGKKVASLEEKNGAQKKASTPTKSGNSQKRKHAEDYSVFKPTCARLLSYGFEKKFHTLATDVCFHEKPRNLREKMMESNTGDMEREDKTTSGRAARANQRRVMKDVASFGATNSLAIDTLASREPQLRFDRSGIHAWGVFADEDIAAGEMIIEYRGELIGNAIAEKREKEYEAAKIGSDYMFRIDALHVCDATKQGNVARFINASCGPNCYTKIITLDGNKRIVIYAKRNIRAGEELCYDYKFPLEYDESKRIPCHCGARECRGFMNWDKRYVALSPKLKQDLAMKPDVPAEVADNIEDN